MLILGIVLEDSIFPFDVFDLEPLGLAALGAIEVALLLGGTRSVGFNAEADGADGLRTGSAGFEVLEPSCVCVFGWAMAETETPIARAFVD